MEKVKSNIMGICIGVCFWFCVFFGFFKDVEGLKNIAIFIAWFCFIGSLSIQIEGIITDEILENRLPKLIRDFILFIDIICVLVFSFYGEISTGFIFFISIFLTKKTFDQADEK